ncbi:hypothetical protein ABT160_07625 [Streptomyces sp. NPDC001941]|uniref:hypothetical protein n=1 Tax=Streptomyces sp. NPDC001941 TaxID=3154659 RepID=UPI0033190A46
MTNTLTLTAQDKTLLRTAAYGAVSLLAAADPAGSPHKAATAGSIALASSTGPIGHVLADKAGSITIQGKTVAAMADHVLPALTQVMQLLKAEHPVDADAFRSIVLRALDTAALAGAGRPGPAAADITNKIAQALDSE